ncbi:MAG: ATP-binding protein [Marinisporobacter sp.]|jgi:PAS domain S-box-containing protein|nr:ATP-binding protein [Marinisporobacter sp.]
MEKLTQIDQNELKDIFEFFPLGLMIVDEERMIKQVNQSFGELIGKRIEEMVGKKFGDGIGCPYSIPKSCGNHEKCSLCYIKNSVKKVIETKSPYNNIVFQYPQHGDYLEDNRWLKIHFIPVCRNDENYVMLVMDDITEEKKGEKALNESQEKYQTLLMNMNNGFAYFKAIEDENNHLIDGIYLEVNEAFEKLTGIKKKDIIGKSLLDIAADKSIKDYFYILQREMDVGKGFKLLDYHLAGRDKWCSAYVYIPEKGYWALILTDITEERKIADRMKKAKEAAEAANKAKSEFLANMSHEIRTPLNGIVGMIDLTLMTQLDEEQKDNLLTAKTCANSLMKVIHDILDFSKMEAGKLRIDEIAFDINNLMERIIKIHAVQAENKEVKLHYNFSQDIPKYLLGDPNRLRQILDNLINNAIKFTEQGKVCINIEKIDTFDNEITLKFSVKDTGIGIAKKDKSKIFTSFSQVDSSITRKFGGTGLGLVISKQLVEMMGGRINVESEKDVGSCFYFTLKFKIKEPFEDGIVNDSLIDIHQTLNVLGVEEELINQNVLASLLKKKGDLEDITDNRLEAMVLGETKIELKKEEQEKAFNEIKAHMQKLEEYIENNKLLSIEKIAEKIKNLSDQLDLDELKSIAFKIQLAVRREDFDKAIIYALESIHEFRIVAEEFISIKEA